MTRPRGRPKGAVSRKTCQHPPIETFRRIVDGVRLWTCSVCAREAPWSGDHRSFGKVECPKCWGDDVRLVVRSDLCASTAEAMGLVPP